MNGEEGMTGLMREYSHLPLHEKHTELFEKDGEVLKKHTELF
ncbi:hypothetical protein [uncultured Phocaeicola sp.]|jgi:hypothetical protein|nr:hypothetical protein [uncultured Phocaeicola sp.]